MLTITVNRRGGRLAAARSLTVLPYLGAGILATVSLLHVFWAGGGTRGRRAAIPTSAGKPLMEPSTATTALVAGALATASGLYVGAATHRRPRALFRIGAGGAAIVLAARAIGDRRHVGLFKRVRGTDFARRDTYLYSPLCVLLAAAGAAAAA